jgi:beta-glucosidase
MGAAAAGASLTTLGCGTPPRPGATRLPSAADVPAARKAGTQSPDVEALLSQMTIDEKIGQMTQADMKALQDGEEVHDFLLGSVLSGADSLPKPNEPATWVAMYDRLQTQALATRLGIPMLYGIDAVHGHGAVKGATIFPHNIGMGATHDPAVVEAAARVTAREIAGTGIDWNFAPCLAVARDERWGRTYESYGEDPDLVATLGAAAIRGFEQATDGTAILATAKHFLADGGTQGGKDQGDARISEEDLRRIHLPGYVAAVKAGVGSVMVSYSSWNGQFMHGNKHLITDVLKGELAFGGFVVSDWQAIDRMAPGDYSQAIDLAINAGIDMIMVPNAYRDFIGRLKALVAAGRVQQARIDDAVRRILKQKVRFKLWEKPFTDRALTAEIGSPAHRDVARDAVRKSLVVLKNDKQTLPLKKDLRVHVCGLRADNMGIQCGGWSVGWRGRRGDITPGTTIRKAIEKVVGAGRLDYSENAAGAEKADAVVVVVGEDPYAEGSGDRAKLELSAPDLALVDAAKRSGKPVVLVVLSGRPLILGDVLDAASAVVAAWLPGTEGDGVADVLFGAYKPTGKLPCSWPANMSQIPINVGDPRAAPLFAFGYGLSW